MRCVVALLLGFIFHVAQAQTLVISDIDDTIKISHVQSVSGMALNALKIENHFMGMSGVYHKLLENNPDTHFVYLSNAPRKLLDQTHSFFLGWNRFPVGDLVLRDDLSNKQFKLTTIRKLIASSNPRIKKMILIGDNGESDAAIYAQVEKENPDILIRTFIHQVYSVQNHREPGNRLDSKQVGFVTAIDLAEKFLELNLINQDDFESLVQKYVPLILKEKGTRDSGTLAFPSWIDCRDYVGVVKFKLVASYDEFAVFRWPWEPTPSSADLLADFHEKLIRRCSSYAF